MTLKPGNIYKGKISGEFELNRIKNVSGQPVFVISTTNHSNIELTLDEMREEKPMLVDAQNVADSKPRERNKLFKTR